MSSTTMRQFLTLVLTALLFAGVGMAIKSGSEDHNHGPHEHGAPSMQMPRQQPNSSAARTAGACSAMATLL